VRIQKQQNIILQQKLKLNKNIKHKTQKNIILLYHIDDKVKRNQWGPWGIITLWNSLFVMVCFVGGVFFPQRREFVWHCTPDPLINLLKSSGTAVSYIEPRLSHCYFTWFNCRWQILNFHRFHTFSACWTNSLTS